MEAPFTNLRMESKNFNLAIFEGFAYKSVSRLKQHRVIGESAKLDTSKESLSVMNQSSPTPIDLISTLLNLIR